MKEMNGEHGYVLKPDKIIEEINPDEYNLLIIPGGSPDGAGKNGIEGIIPTYLSNLSVVILLSIEG